MEKQTPHYQLSQVKSLLEAKKVRATQTALKGGSALGLDFKGILAVVASLASKDFYKSMTSHEDYRVWQDVYHPMTKAGAVYMKLTIVEELLIVSFKEL